MDDQSKLRYLLDLAESLDIDIRPSPAPNAEGGSLVRLRRKTMLFLDAQAPQASQIVALATALGQCPEINDMFLPPQIRQAIEKASSDG